MRAATFGGSTAPPKSTAKVFSTGISRSPNSLSMVNFPSCMIFGTPLARSPLDSAVAPSAALAGDGNSPFHGPIQMFEKAVDPPWFGYG